MVRVTRAPARKKRIKKILKHAKGFVGDRKSHHRLAKDAVMKAWAYAFRDRKKKKSNFRSLWIQRINAACRREGISYSRFVNGMQKASIDINRKMLSDLALNDEKAFSGIVQASKKALNA